MRMLLRLLPHEMISIPLVFSSLAAQLLPTWLSSLRPCARTLKWLGYYLMESKFDPHLWGSRLLNTAAGRKNSDIARMLIDRGADVNDQDTNKYTPLMRAVEAESKDNIALLIAKGANVGSANLNGQTALMLAARASDSGIIKLLTDHGAKIDAQDNQGRTALMYAVESCYYWNVKPLLAAGANPQVMNR